MLSIEEIKVLMKELDTSSIAELKYEEEGTKIILRKAEAFPAKAPQQQVLAPASAVQPAVSTAAAPAAVPDKAVAEEPEAVDSLHKVTAPMVGTFYSSSSPDAEPYVKKGSKVDKKTVVCSLEAMKLFNEIEAECKGTIVDVLAEDGQLVEYGQPLFLVKED
ncbi:MAG: acetyl-CoA carboxylase biotin carboxyl carrier protein [Sporolactobacillus sp.]